MDQKERQRKRALIVLQIVIYGYLLTMFGIQLYMSFATRVVGVVNLPLLNRISGSKSASAPDGTVEPRGAPRRIPACAAPCRQVDDRRCRADGHVGARA